MDNIKHLNEKKDVKIDESKDLYEQIKNSTENTYNKVITEKEYDK